MFQKAKGAPTGASKSVGKDAVLDCGQVAILKQSGLFSGIFSSAYFLVIEQNNNYVDVKDFGKVKKVANGEEILKAFSSNYSLQRLLQELCNKNDARVIEAALRTPWLKTYEPFNNSCTKLFIYMIELGHIPIMECLFYSHSDEIEWSYVDKDSNSLFHLILYKLNGHLTLIESLFIQKIAKLSPFLTLINKSNRSLFSIACNKKLESIIEILINAGATILVQDPLHPDNWILPEFTAINMGVYEDKEVVIYPEIIKGKFVFSLIRKPTKVNLLPEKTLTPFHKVLPKTKLELLPQILNFPSPSLTKLALDKGFLKEFTNLLLLAVKYAHPVVLREILKHKDPSTSQTQIEQTTRNNILHRAIELRKYDNLEILMQNCEPAAVNRNLESRNSSGLKPINLAIEEKQYIAINIIFYYKHDLMAKEWLNMVEKAIINSNVDFLRMLMTYFNIKYDRKCMYENTNNQGLTVLHIAVSKCESKEIFDVILEKYKTESASKQEILIDCRINSHFSTELNGFTPLLMSLKEKRYFATEMLLKAGASRLNEGNLCYFHYLIQNCDNKEGLEQLLNIELNSNQFSNYSKNLKVKVWEVKDDENNTLLHYSVKCCNLVAVELLGTITPFQYLLTPDSKGNTLLHTAVVSQNPDLMGCLTKVLEKHRSHKQYRELLDLQNNGCTALMVAVSSNSLGAVDSLIKEGASILPLNHDGDSILHIAAKEGKEEIFRLILDFINECRIDKPNNIKLLHQPNSGGYPPIQCAVNYGQVGIVRIFREKYDLSICDNNTGYSLLHIAVLSKSVNFQVRKNLIDELLTNKTLLEVRDRDGRTPLMLSVINQNVDSINLLLPYNPDLATIDDQGLSILHNAIISYEKQTFDKILKTIKSSNNGKKILNLQENNNKRTALHYAIVKNNREATEELLKLGFPLETQDIEGNSCIHIASESSDRINIAKIIISHAKTSPNNIIELLRIQNKEDFTPLHYAISKKNYEACKLLTNEKTNLFYETNNGPGFHQTINRLPLIICEYKTDCYIGYCFPRNGNNTCWIVSALDNLNDTTLVPNTSSIKVIHDLNYFIVQKIVSCPQLQPLQTLLQQVDFSNCSSQRKKSSLYMPAAEYGSFPVTRFLIKELFKLDDLMDTNHGSLLCGAISNPNIKILEELCKTVQRLDCNDTVGKILNTKQESGAYPLESCVKLSNVEAFVYLLSPEFQLKINFIDTRGGTIIHHILEHFKRAEDKTRLNFLEIVVTSIKIREKNLPKSTYITDTPLVNCSMHDSLKTPLHLCASKYPDCIRTLLQLNPNPIQGDSCGDTALHLAVKSGNVPCVNEIINEYKNNGLVEITNKPNNKKLTPLHTAVYGANVEIVKLLLTNQSRFYAVDDQGMTVLHYAVQIKDSSKSEKMVKFLLKYETDNPEPNQSLSICQDNKGYTPLHSAIACSNVKATDILLNCKFDHILRDLEGNTILHLALIRDKTKTIVNSILKGLYHSPIPEISNEDDFINLKNDEGKTALFLSVQTQNVGALEQILKFFPLLYLKDNDKNSYLHKAVENTTDLRCLGILLEIIKERCANAMNSYLSAVNGNGLSPLHNAIKLNNHGAVVKLLEYGANIAIQRDDGTLTLCNGNGIKFSIAIGPPSSKWRTIGNFLWKDMKDYFICYGLFSNGKSYQIASLLPNLESTMINTDNNLKAITDVTERSLQMICSCHCIEPLIHAIGIGWLGFFKDESENNVLWDVLCGDISDEVTNYLFMTYPEQMKSPRMFKSIEIATKKEDKSKVLTFLGKHPNLGEQIISKPNEKLNVKKITENTLALTIKNSLEYSITCNKNTDILDILLQHDARINHLYENNATLLHIIIREGKPVEFLTSILELIKQLQSSESEKQLIEGIPLITHQNSEGKTALHLCIESGNLELLGKLLEYHPDFTLRDNNENNVVHYVAKLGLDSVADLIFDHITSSSQNNFIKTFSNESNTDGCTPLHFAAGSGSENIFCTLLNQGADLDAIDKLEQTVLHHALKSEENQICRIDIHSQTNPIPLTESKDTPQHIAVSSGNDKIIDIIISRKTNSSNDPSLFDCSMISKQDKDGKTPLHLSIENKNHYALEKLLPLTKCGLEIADNSRDTLLHYAVRVSEGKCEYLMIILQEFKSRYPEDFEARLHPCNSNGFPPLQYAIESNKPEAAILLIKNSVKLPYCGKKNEVIMFCPDSINCKLQFYQKPRTSKDFPGVYWIGFQLSINWFVSSLPELSKTEHFNETNPLTKSQYINRELLIAILQCHSTDPFKTAVNSNLITKHSQINGPTLLEYVGRYSTKEVVDYFIDWSKCIIFESRGQSSLIEYAVTNSDQSILQFLLEKITPVGDQSLTPPQLNDTEENKNKYKIGLCLKNALKLSLDNSTTKALDILLQFNARYDHTYNEQNTLLHLMVLQPKPCEFIRLLLTRVNNIKSSTPRFIDAQNNKKETALHIALQKKQEDIIKTILEFHPEIVSHDSNGNTPLHLSILLNSFEIIETILKLSEQNLDIINAVNTKQKFTPLHFSVDNGDYNATELLLRSGADIYCQDSENKTILHHAINIADSGKRALMFKELIQFEDRTFSSNKLCTIQDAKGNTPLNLAITMSDNDIVNKLLDFPAVLKVTNKLKQTPLHLVVIEKDEKNTDSILDAIKKIEDISEHIHPTKESIINSQDSTGCTPLHLCIQHKNTDALTKILVINPALDIFNDNREQPLHLAVLSKEDDILDQVLDSILRQESESIGWFEQRLTCVRQKDGKTPLHLSIEIGNIYALKALLSTKPCLDIGDLNGDTILHCAAKNRDDESKILEIVLEELTERFCEDYSYFVYRLNSRNLTPLHCSIKCSNINCIKQILENGVNLAFPKPCGDITLLDGIEGFVLSFVKWNEIYWVGYKFTCKHKKTCLIVSKLPDLDQTEIIETNLSTLDKSDLKLLEVMSQAKSTEPLNAALRTGLLDLKTSLKDQQGYIQIYQVIARHGSKQSLRCLLDKTTSGLFHRNDGKETMIECAVSNPNIDALEYLLHSLPPFQGLQSGVGNEEHGQIRSCLKKSCELSISNSSPCALISLLRFYPKIGCTYVHDNTLIHLMVIKNKSSEFLHKVLRVITEIENTANLQIINHINSHKKTALHCCIENKQVELLYVLLKFNPDPYLVDENDETSLHCAVNTNKLEYVQAMYKHAPYSKLLSAQNKDENTVLHLAVQNAHHEIVNYLINCEEPPFEIRNSSGSTVLHLAVEVEDTTKRKLIMEELLRYNTKKGYNATCIQDSKKKCPLHLAVTKLYLNAVELLLHADPKVLRIQDNKNQTPLHLTIIPPCSTGQVIQIDEEIRDKIFDSVLHTIKVQGEHEYKGDCNGNHLICIQDVRMRTAMHYAIEHHYLYAFKELLKTGSCLDLPDDFGNTLAHEAVKKNSDVEFLKRLVEELESRHPNLYDCFN